ncbi:DUF5615 family PIN-like protein [Bradyrhizobium sp.]|uniref:DUF5615 family PIN-like protein n=1 Tax=Bradyrhizobium sp. TaxID=376 RepID=UPI003BB0F21A
MRFLIDMPLSPVLATWLADRGHAAGLGLHAATDSQIMARAKHEARTVVTISTIRACSQSHAPASQA